MAEGKSPTGKSELLYGHHAVLEALRAGRRRFERVLVAEESEGAGPSALTAEALRLAERANIPVARLPKRELDRLVGRDHRGLAAQVSPYPYASWPDVVARALEGTEPPFLLLLDHVQDPQNLGTLLRTAEAVAVHGVALPRDRAAGITPAVSNASAGAVEHLAIAQVTNMARTVEELKKQGIWVVGLERTPEALNGLDADLNGPLALVVGSEGKGMSRLVREKCDFVLQLPMRGKVSSLNVSVAGSVVLYLAWQQRLRQR